MKFKRKSLSEEGMKSFNMHLGIGQNKDMTDFYQNYFIMVLPKDFNLNTDNKAQAITINNNNWFQNPNTYDFIFGDGSIMQNQQALIALFENGKDVFSICKSGK